MADSKKTGEKHIAEKFISIFTAVLLFAGIFLLLAFALALVSGGIFVIPSAFLRIIGRGDFFVSDVPQFTMLFLGGFMFFLGIAILIVTVCRVCPASANYMLRRFSEGK